MCHIEDVEADIVFAFAVDDELVRVEVGEAVLLQILLVLEYACLCFYSVLVADCDIECCRASSVRGKVVVNDVTF